MFAPAPSLTGLITGDSLFARSVYLSVSHLASQQTGPARPSFVLCVQPTALKLATNTAWYGAAEVPGPILRPGSSAKRSLVLTVAHAGSLVADALKFYKGSWTHAANQSSLARMDRINAISS